MNTQKILQAGKIASLVREYSKSIILKDVPLLEIAEKIESKIIELGGKPAFPVSLAIDNIAAHCTPFPDDKTKASGLLKVDFGIHIDGWLVDTAFSVDLENSEENKKLIQASEKALENVVKIFNEKSRLGEIGKIISGTIESYGFSPIVNLSGHEIRQYTLHAGITIPNIDNNSDKKIKKGVYAIEPFASTGEGKIHDGNPSEIYLLTNERNVRSLIAKEILEFVKKEYNTLPFCSRWLVKKFGAKAIIGLKHLESNGNLHHFAQLIEKSGVKISQAEHTILVGKEVIVVTLN